jgi:hypothetical protein
MARRIPDALAFLGNAGRWPGTAMIASRFHPKRGAWAHDKILRHPGRAELLLCPDSWAAQQRRPTKDVKNSALHPGRI